MAWQKLLSLETIARLVRDLRGQGKKVCLTHGAFDLFHISHLDLLNKSAMLCDFLIVGVESDASVAKYKSDKRPIINQYDRVNILSSLKPVDAVFVKDVELTSKGRIGLYNQLMPNYITIGQHYFIEDEITHDAEKAGAELVKIWTKQEPTTTSIINEINERYIDG